MAYWLSEQYEKAIAMIKKALDRSPDFLGATVFLTAAYISSGQEKNARAAAKEVLRIDFMWYGEFLIALGPQLSWLLLTDRIQSNGQAIL